MRLRSTFGILVVAVGVAAAVSVTFALQESSPHKVLFEKATFTMETKGDLQGAIALFEEVVKKYPNERDYAAQALLQIGICYEKLGLAKAQDAYQRLIKNYPGQTASVAAARERLESLSRMTAATKAGEREVTIRKIPTPKLLATGAISPDGRYCADVGENECDLRIIELLTGRERFLTKGKPSSWSPRWSADSTKLIVDRGGLDVVALNGAAPRTVVPPVATQSLEPLDWSADQTHVVAIQWPLRQPSAAAKLVAVTVADGSLRTLSGLDFADWPTFDCRFSPDGLYIACSRGVSTRDIFLLTVDGSQESAIVRHPADDGLLAWLPDGRGILFASNRAGTIDMWSQQIAGGQPKGGATLVRRNIGPTTPMRLTEGGALYYQTPSPFMDVYTASLDPGTGRVAGPPKKEPLSYEGSGRFPDWSPDGKFLAYVSSRPAVVGPYLPGRARDFLLCIYSADTGKVREYPGIRVSSVRWSSEGRHLYVTPTNVDGRGIYRVDVASGQYTQVLQEASVGGLAVSADGQWIVFCRNRRLLRRNLQNGEEKALDGPGVYPGHVALSRDSSRLAWIIQPDEKTWILKVMHFPDGTPSEIQRLKNPDSRIAWSPDGRFIYYSDVPPAGGKDCHLWRVPADGGAAQDLGSAANYHENISVHPDGTRITFSTSTLNPEPAQLWVIENFLPAIKR